MVPTTLHQTLYQGNPGCLGSSSYEIEEVTGTICGPCYFRQGFRDELPARVSFREYSGLFGAPQYHPHLITHLTVSMGLVPPEPGEKLTNYRRRRSRNHLNPSPKLFPFISALWELMGYQPPLARVLIKFCEGKNEIAIANEMDLSLYNVQERLSKAARVSQKFLWRNE